MKTVALLRVLAVTCAFGLLSACSLAGYYTVTYTTGGTTTVDWITGGVEVSNPYNPLYEGGFSVAPTGWVKNYGTITAKMTWVPNPAIPNDQPPPFVVVAQAGSAYWTGDSGYANDGLGDPEVDGTSNDPDHGPNMGTSAGIHYSIYDNPGTGFTLSDNPTSYGYGSLANGLAVHARNGGGTKKSFGQGIIGNPPPLIPTGRVSAYVAYTVSVWTPSMVLSNITVGSDGSWNIQVGTPTTATLFWTDDLGNQLSQLPHTLDITNYTWNVQGTAFSSWYTSLGYAALNPTIQPNAPNFSFVWADGGSQAADGRTMASPIVEVTIYAGTTYVGSGYYNNITVGVWRPYIDFVGFTPSTPAYTWPGPSYVTAGETTIAFNTGVSDVFGPSAGTKSAGQGSVNFCQLVNMSDTAVYGALSKTDNTSGQYLLDANSASTDWYWIINGSGGPADELCVIDQAWPASPQDPFTDAPGMSLQYLWSEADSWSASYSFENWLMYVPTGGVYVPLTEQTWSWDDAASAPYGTSPPTAPSSFGWWERTDTFPVWTGYHNGG